MAVARVSHGEHRANIQLQRKGKQEEASFCTYLTVIATHMHTNKLEDGAGVALARVACLPAACKLTQCTAAR